MKLTVLCLFFLALNAVANATAGETLAPQYYGNGGLCAIFMKQQEHRYFGTPGDKKISICAYQDVCEMSLDHPFILSGNGTMIWISVNGSEAFLPVQTIASYSQTGTLRFNCPEKELNIQFALEKNSVWDNNGGADYKVILKK